MDEQKRKITQSVAKQIYSFRRENGMSQEEVALRANLNPAYFGQVERGLKCPTIDTIYKVAHALDVAPCELLGGNLHGDNRKEYLSRVTVLLRQIPEEKLEEVLHVIEAVAKLAELP